MLLISGQGEFETGLFVRKRFNLTTTLRTFPFFSCLLCITTQCYCGICGVFIDFSRLVNSFLEQNLVGRSRKTIFEFLKHLKWSQVSSYLSFFWLKFIFCCCDCKSTRLKFYKSSFLVPSPPRDSKIYISRGAMNHGEERRAVRSRCSCALATSSRSRFLTHSQSPNRSFRSDKKRKACGRCR